MEKAASATALPTNEINIEKVSLTYHQKNVLQDISLKLPTGCMIGFIGADGVGKSSLLSLIAGSRKIQTGKITILGYDMEKKASLEAIRVKIAYMPQGLGKNLYPTLSVYENIDFFARLFGIDDETRHDSILHLLTETQLLPFRNRPAGKLSGGMKQKLGLCCALIHSPQLLVLDEPTTGVDPLSRRQFWRLIETLRLAHPQMTVLIATAYMPEAEQCDWLVPMNAGKILDACTKEKLLATTQTKNLEDALITLLNKTEDNTAVLTLPTQQDYKKFGDINQNPLVIQVKNLSKRFGDFTAVNKVNFNIKAGEIFGFCGSNGCGKTTVMKMLTGLLPITEGEAFLFNEPVNANDLSIRKKIGYMSQSFSLYSELTVQQNLYLHAKLFHLPADFIAERIHSLLQRFSLTSYINNYPNDLPIGIRQRLSVAVAIIHQPQILIFDEPTSGVDPIARNLFWQLLLELSRKDKVTIFISTHFMNEAERCDRIAFMHEGNVLVADTPENIKRIKNKENLEAAFISYLEAATEENKNPCDKKPQGIFPFNLLPTRETRVASDQKRSEPHNPNARFPLGPPREQCLNKKFSIKRMLSYSLRESLELIRDPLRASLALLGSLILMLIMTYGTNMDVEHLPFAVLDLDHSTVSRNYIDNIASSKYFTELPALSNYKQLDQRMRSGKLSLAIEIPYNFARDIKRGKQVNIGAWIDGAMPQRAEIERGYLYGAHQQWLKQTWPILTEQKQTPLFHIETRFRYNPDINSLPVIVPTMIPLLLMLITAMLTALSVVREKELGSIVNLYVTPIKKFEFFLGKIFPYVVLAMLNFTLLLLLSFFAFNVAVKGSLSCLLLATFIYVTISATMGFLISTFMRSQIAAIFATAILTLLPAMQFSGVLRPVASLQGLGAFIGKIYPTTHYLTISQGVFSKGLGFLALWLPLFYLLSVAPILFLLSILMLKKQER